MSRRVVAMISCAVVGALLAGCDSGSQPPAKSSRADGPRTRVVCASADGSPLDAASVRSTLQRRATAGGGADVRADVSGTTATTTVTGRVDAKQLCASGSLAFRPVLAPSAPVSCGSGSATKCSAQLAAETLPRSESEYDALSEKQRQRIAAGLAAADCDAFAAQRDVPDTRSRVACSEPDSGQRFAYLLGPAIVSSGRIKSAKAVPPSTTGQGSTQWTVSLSLTAAGSQAWGEWTTAHNTGNAQTADLATCARYSVPCSDYVGFVYDGLVVSAPATNEPIVGRPTQISGNFTRTTATVLALELDAGALPTLTVRSVERVR